MADRAAPRRFRCRRPCARPWPSVPRSRCCRRSRPPAPRVLRKTIRRGERSATSPRLRQWPRGAAAAMIAGMSPPRIYLDNAATTRPLDSVVAAMAKAQTDLFGNPSSKHAFGPGARRALDDAREFLRGTLGAAQVVFTSGGSEADYLGIVGSAMARPAGRVLMAQSDHPAMLGSTALLARCRHHVSALPVTAHGDLDPEVLFDALGADVRTVALLFGHNELGTLCQLEELVGLVRRAAPGAHVHVDLVQTYG